MSTSRQSTDLTPPASAPVTSSYGASKLPQSVLIDTPISRETSAAREQVQHLQSVIETARKSVENTCQRQREILDNFNARFASLRPQRLDLSDNDEEVQLKRYDIRPQQADNQPPQTTTSEVLQLQANDDILVYEFEPESPSSSEGNFSIFNESPEVQASVPDDQDVESQVPKHSQFDTLSDLQSTATAAETAAKRDTNVTRQWKPHVAFQGANPTDRTGHNISTAPPPTQVLATKTFIPLCEQSSQRAKLQLNYPIVDSDEQTAGKPEPRPIPEMYTQRSQQMDEAFTDSLYTRTAQLDRIRQQQQQLDMAAKEVEESLMADRQWLLFVCLFIG
jgi:hypothetical protein